MAKILIVEDSSTQAAIISEIVTRSGHEAVVCSDFSKGVIPSVRSSQPDIVLLDLVLLGPDGTPRADGFQVCREIKRLPGEKISVVVVSAKGDRDSAEWALMQGADAFLQKPFAVDDLVKVIENQLEQRRGSY